MHGADFAFTDIFGVLEGEAEDSFGGLFGDEFDGLDYTRDDAVFDSGVFALGVFADEDGVNVGVGGLVAGDGFAGADIGEEVEGAAEGEVEGDVAFTDGGLT